MKKLFKNYFSLTAIVVAGLITAYFSFIIFGGRWTTPSRFEEGGHESVEMPDGRFSDTAFGGTSFSSWHSVPDTLSYRKGKQMEDSIRQIQQRIDMENKSSFISGFNYGFFGVASMDKPPADIYAYTPFDTGYTRYSDNLYKIQASLKDTKDSAKIKAIKATLVKMEKDYNDKKEQEKENNQLYYITMSGFPLKDYNSSFYISNGRYYLKYVQWDSVKKAGTDSNRWGHFASKEIPVRYATDDKKIMIPVTEKTFKTVRAVLNIWNVMSIFIYLYVVFGLPIQLLVNISRGNAFIPKNIRILKQMSAVLFVFFLLDTFLPYLLRWAFSRKIPGDFASPRLDEAIITHFYLLLAAIILFLIGSAFRKGYKLQQEQELTV